jgi:hypothetical protein
MASTKPLATFDLQRISDPLGPATGTKYLRAHSTAKRMKSSSATSVSCVTGDTFSRLLSHSVRDIDFAAAGQVSDGLQVTQADDRHDFVPP